MALLEDGKRAGDAERELAVEPDVERFSSGRPRLGRRAGQRRRAKLQVLLTQVLERQRDPAEQAL
eukprot:349026-Pleurochrysis_carterae.AAC.1